MMCVSTRRVFDGGEIERGKAAYFRKLAEHHNDKFPSVTIIFLKLAKGFELDASRMDERANKENLNIKIVLVVIVTTYSDSQNKSFRLILNEI